MKDYVCAIDIGTSLLRVLVARILKDESIEILGAGVVPSKGIRGGAIVNIEQATASLADAAREAELVSGLIVDEALLGISGRHLRGDNSRGVVAITNKDRIVREGDVLRVVEGARNIRLLPEHEIIHVLSREFTVDDQTGIRDPIGMTGVRLEAEVHIVSALSTAISNLEKVASGAGIRMTNAVMNSLAAAEAVLSQGEKDLGVAVIDIGGGVCDIIVYREGGVCGSTFIPIGGGHVTQDVSIGLRMPLESAEFVKKTYGYAKASLADPTESVEISGLPGRPSRRILRQDIALIMEARLREILEMANEELIRMGQKKNLSGGVILTGGGSLVEGIESLAEEIFGMNCSSASPSRMTGFTDRVNGPDFATVSGLVRYAAGIAGSGSKNVSSGERSEKGETILRRLKGWINENL